MHGRARILHVAFAALFTLMGALLPVVAAAADPAAVPACQRVELFHTEVCPHCAHARAMLRELARETPALELIERDVARDPGASRAFMERFQRLPGVRAGVPLVDVCGTLVVGYESDQTTGALLRKLVWEGTSGTLPVTDSVSLPAFGRISASELGLPLFTLAIGLVDGFNPCAMWVLLFLLSVLVNLRSRARILAVAGTFVLVSGLVYFAFMAAWLELFLVIGFSRALQVFLGLTALLVAAINLKDFVAPGVGVSLSIPARVKPDLYARVRTVVHAENLVAAVAAVSVLAVLVNMLELLCTAGLPALYTQILSRQGLSTAGYYGYLGLYNLAYVFDDALMVAVVTWTLRRTKVQERAGRWLKLLSGVAVGLLGIALLFAPGWLF